MSEEVGFNINPAPRVLHSFGDVALPIEWGNDHATHESGVVLNATGLVADAEGRKLARAGSVLVPDTGNPGQYRVLASSTDGDADGAADAVAAADPQAVILKFTADLAQGPGLVGVYIRGGFLGTRMPSVADNSVLGLEATVKTALKAQGFRFGEDF